MELLLTLVGLRGRSVTADMRLRAGGLLRLRVWDAAWAPPDCFADGGMGMSAD